MFEPNTHRYTNCEWCGRRFVDDCGDSFCSSSCTNQYEDYHTECAGCGDEKEDGEFIDGVCENCREEDDE